MKAVSSLKPREMAQVSGGDITPGMHGPGVIHPGMDGPGVVKPGDPSVVEGVERVLGIIRTVRIIWTVIEIAPWIPIILM